MGVQFAAFRKQEAGPGFRFRPPDGKETHKLVP